MITSGRQRRRPSAAAQLAFGCAWQLRRVRSGSSAACRRAGTSELYACSGVHCLEPLRRKWRRSLISNSSFQANLPRPAPLAACFSGCWHGCVAVAAHRQSCGEIGRDQCKIVGAGDHAVSHAQLRCTQHRQTATAATRPVAEGRKRDGGAAILVVGSNPCIGSCDTTCKVDREASEGSSGSLLPPRGCCRAAEHARAAGLGQ